MQEHPVNRSTQSTKPMALELVPVHLNDNFFTIASHFLDRSQKILSWEDQ